MESAYQTGRGLPSNQPIASICCCTMELAPALARYAYALGRWQATWRFASPELRRAVSLAQISAAWDIFLRDAGPGDVGPAHEAPESSTALLTSDDPRRDGVLLWLADYGAPVIAEAAALVAHSVGASRGFGAEEQDLLDAARNVPAETARPGAIARLLPPLRADAEHAMAPLRAIAATVDQLRGDPAFVESTGDQVHHLLPGGAFSHYVPAPPAAAWALNLALLARSAPLAGTMACPALISRQLFRAFEPDEIAAALVEGVTAALETGHGLFERIEPELARGREALARMSRNSRTRDAWLLVVALGGMSRAQLARALGLSRAGADIQAHALAEAELVTCSPASSIKWARHRQADTKLVRPDDAVDEPSGTFEEFDANMAEIDRLLARAANQPRVLASYLVAQRKAGSRTNI